MKPTRALSAALGLLLAAAAAPVWAAETHVAVAANFTDAANEIASVFKKKTGHDAVLSFGSSGQLYTQITQEAPFDILLSADEARPTQAIEDGLGVAESRFTYAIGKLVLWSKDAGQIRGEATLKEGRFAKLAIANPTTAPYGAAAVEVMKTLGVYEELETKLVQGNTIAQTFQFVDSANAEVGFVAFSQVAGKEEGSRWLVPQRLYGLIRQDAVLLKKGAENEAAVAFMTFLKSPEAAGIIETFGYGLDAES